MADESKEGILYDSLAFLTKKLVIEGVFLQTYEFKCPKSNNGGPVSNFKLMFPQIFVLAQINYSKNTYLGIILFQCFIFRF